MSPTPAGVIATTVILGCISSTGVAARFLVRKMYKHKMKSDDWTILVGLMLTWGLAIILIIGAASEVFGRHGAIDPVTGKYIVTSKDRDSSKYSRTFYLLMSPTLGTIKLSVLLFYRRLFLGPMFSRYTLALSVIIVMWSLSFFLANAFLCGTHLSASWTSLAAIEQYCIDAAAMSLGFAVSDVVTDLMVLAIPQPVVWRLHLSKPQRVALCGVFGLGLLSTAASIVRMVMEINNNYVTEIRFRDVRGLNTNLTTWGFIEASLGVLAACLPTLRPLAQNLPSTHLLSTLRSKLSLRSLRRSPKSSDTSSDLEILGTHENVHLRDMARNEHFQPSMYTTVVAGPKTKPGDGLGPFENGIRKAVEVYSL